MADDRFDHIFIEPTSFDASLTFYRDSLGWQVLFSWGGEGSPRGAGLRSGGGMSVVLAERHPAVDHSKSHGINGTRPTVHVLVADIQARYEAVRQSGAALFAPERNHWGTTWFVARDPDGNLVAFEQKPAG